MGGFGPPSATRQGANAIRNGKDRTVRSDEAVEGRFGEWRLSEAGSGMAGMEAYNRIWRKQD